MKMISVIIPVYNEENILEQSVYKVHEYLNQSDVLYEIIAVSNGSTDGTSQIGASLDAKLEWFRFFELSDRSPGRAFCKGVNEARGEYLATLDADLSSDLAFLMDALYLLDYCDMVVGCKTTGNQRRKLTRILGSHFYILFAKASFDLSVQDFSMGCKAYRRDLILNALDHLDPWTGYTFELCLYLHYRGCKIAQIGIECEDRRKSRFNLLHEGVYRYRHLL